MDGLRIVNITASFKADREFDLSTLCKDPLTYPSRIAIKDGKPRQFQSAVRSIIVDGKIVTALIYRSGSVVLVGGQSPEMVRRAMDSFLNQEDSHQVTPLVFSNYVMTLSVDHNLNLTFLYEIVRTHHLLTCPVYEVELFPSLLISYGSIKASVFHTGRVIITGCKHPTQGQEMYNILISLIK